MHYVEVVKDALVATLVAICGKQVYHKFKRWYYNTKCVEINDVHIEFIPQTTEEETILLTEKNHKPKVFKFFLMLVNNKICLIISQQLNP